MLKRILETDLKKVEEYNSKDPEECIPVNQN